MERFTLNIEDVKANKLKQLVTDLLASNEAFYRLALELANLTDSNAGQVEPDDLEKFSEYLDEDTTYYTVELLYMVQYAMDDVTTD